MKAQLGNPPLCSGLPAQPRHRIHVPACGFAYFGAPNLASPISCDMAENVVIRAEGLGKKYAIGHAAEREPYIALRDVLVREAHNLWRKAAHMAQGRAIIAGDTVEEFWALKDVSFEVKRGEVLGIIGRNGAGKSTLLKILSRITEPSEGRVTIKGRVAALLEVGTGFHPELTGRENIYLNGAILGMTRAEIRKKFDEIVAFLEVEKFLDTPVKRYSSGMYVRLAFAVAAHLDPEILVVDEVLAVGDVEFQKKCLGKMEAVTKHNGRTVIFVSHNLAAVEGLCSKALLVHKGRILVEGDGSEVIRAFLEEPRVPESVGSIFEPVPPSNFLRAELQTCAGSAVNSIKMGDPLRIVVNLIDADVLSGNKLIGFSIHDARGVKIGGFHTGMRPAETRHRGDIICFDIHAVNLSPGRYSIDLSLTRGVTEYIEKFNNCLNLTVVEGDIFGHGFKYTPDYGIIYLDTMWFAR
jgi:lipopolysaccharide transport system ATP-binding protein